ncbi:MULTISPECIES: PPC domain-containing protein [Myxococcus]|uniref:PPC domain-containing protein n=1 Tax=Myxococcus TaxID=32 RepID=UPI001128E8A6|nr:MULTISPECIES: PPC domain-containing protein [Myxococcus]QDE80403.1 hypothetical protein BHS07_01840 [Myxococcus xanthus]WAM26880.1 PPC domain-containing protein [Myxococcus sp. NMCA1]
MKTVPCLLAWSAMLSLSGCADTGDDCGLVPLPGGMGQSPPLLSLEVPAELHVQPSMNFTCEGPDTSQVPDSITAEVFDPNNHTVASEASLTGNGQAATVRFTPTTTGRHHVRVAFAPVGSLQQFGAYVSRAWTGGGPTVLPLPRCTQLDRTTHGTWLCDGVAVHAANGTQTPLGGVSGMPDVAVAGNVVWVVGEDRVRRFVDTGSELELTGSLLLNQRDTVKVIQSRLATADELWVLDSERLHRFAFTPEGVVTGAAPTPWGRVNQLPFGVDMVLGLLVRLGPDTVSVIQATQDPDSRACTFRLGPDGAFVASEAPCQRLPGVPAGIEDGAVWTRVDSLLLPQPGQTLYRWAAVDGALTERGTLVVDAPLELVSAPLRPGFAIPFIQWRQSRVGSAVPVPPESQGPLGLELLPGNADLSPGLRTLSPRFYWEAGGGQGLGGTRVYERRASPLK